jgi:hypothetical protein
MIYARFMYINGCLTSQAIAANEVGADMGKSVIIHMMTDGLPTDAHGNSHGQMEAVKSWIQNRKLSHKALISITLCTNDESIHEGYESLDQGVGVDINAVRKPETNEVSGHDSIATHSPAFLLAHSFFSFRSAFLFRVRIIVIP